MTLTLHSKTAILPFLFEMTCGAFGGPSVDVSIPIITMALDFIDSHKYLKVYMSAALVLKAASWLQLACSGRFPAGLLSHAAFDKTKMWQNYRSLLNL